MNVRQMIAQLCQYDMDAEVRCLKFGDEELDEADASMSIEEIGDDDEVVILYFNDPNTDLGIEAPDRG